MFIISSRAFGLWLDVVCLIYISIVTFSFIVISDGGKHRTCTTKIIIIIVPCSDWKINNKLSYNSTIWRKRWAGYYSSVRAGWHASVGYETVGRIRKQHDVS